MRAKDRCATVYHMGADETRAAPEARLTLSAVSLELFGKAPALSPRVAVIAEAGTARLDRFGQHRHDRIVERVGFVGRERSCGSRGVNAGAPQRLVGVDVTD